MSHSVPTSSNFFGSRPDDVPHMTKLLADVSIASTAPEPPEIQVDAGRSEAEPYTSGLLVSSSFDDTDSSIMNIDGSVYDSEDGYVTDESTVGSISVPPSILHHMFEDGIRCHAFRDRRYAFPNDENEQNRDDMKHAMTVLLCDNRLHFAPIDSNPQKVIDLGTGSGMWALESMSLCFRNHYLEPELCVLIEC